MNSVVQNDEWKLSENWKTQNSNVISNKKLKKKLSNFERV